MSPHRVSLITARKRVEGLGSARAGTLHFWHQRLTAVALIPLSIWFVASALAYVGAEQGAVAAYFARPINAIPMFLFIVAAVYHMSLGLQIIIEDYFHQEGLKIALLLLNRFAAWIIGAAAGLALIKMALGAPA
jgi:succinate dehydrogenase / fumarate reductase membrane anchor subunit